jgi:hypothetical protein
MATQLLTAAGDIPPDPDAQATVTDFLDYTDFLPSDLIRSLTLIEKLDQTYLASTDTVHDLTKSYGSLPSIPPNKRLDARALRQQISCNLDYAIEAREAAFAEASRLYDVVDRHYNRLTSIISKLNCLPKPPSRDATPAPQPQTSHTSRNKVVVAEKAEGTPPPRITLRFDGQRAPGSATRTNGSTLRPRYRNRKVTVPGEVMPPPNPDSPPPITDSEWEFQPPSPVPMATSRVGVSGSRPLKPGRVRPPKPPKIDKPNTPKVVRPPRPPGAMGTNVHSAIAGISTSNALSLLEPPPPDAKPGSEHAPWMRLTEWEMAKLRKRMKKNAIWSPSETMIKRELADAGRGPDNYRSSKSKAEAAGEEFTDFDQIANAPPGKPLAPGEISADLLGLEETQLSNKGMKLNEAKKLKRELMAREAALAAAEAEQAGKRLNGIGKLSNNVFSRPGEQPVGTPSIALIQQKARVTETERDKEISKSSTNKRKRDPTPKSESNLIHSDGIVSQAKPVAKRRRAVPKPPPINVYPTGAKPTTIPLAAPTPSAIAPLIPTLPMKSPTEVHKVAPPATRSRRLSLTLKSPARIPEHPSSYPPSFPPPPTLVSCPPSRAASRRGSSGAPLAQSTRELRRKSATPAPPTPIITAAGRRSKRPAPGPVTSSQDGGAAVSEGRRKNAPRRRGNATASQAKKQAEDAGQAKEREEEAKAEEEAAGEEIDPDEPRYCVCGDVSFGTMICCENTEVRVTFAHSPIHFTPQTPDHAAILTVGYGITVRKGMVPSRVRRLAGTARKTDEVVLPRLQN